MSLFDGITSIFKRNQTLENVAVQIPPSMPFDEGRMVEISKEGRANSGIYRSWDDVYIDSGDRKTGLRYGKLTYKELEEIADQTPIIKAIIDSAGRFIAGQNWDIVSIDEEKPVPKEELKRIYNLFLNPNKNKESMTSIFRKLVRDGLIYDAAALEKALNKKSPPEVTELYARDASTFQVDINQKGLIEGYKQKVRFMKEPILFKPEEIVYMTFNPKTSSQYGTPALDALVNQISTYILLNANIRDTVNLNNIQQGLLSFGKIGKTSFDRLVAFLKAKKGGKADTTITAVDDVEDVKFTKFNRDATELRASQLIRDISRMIYECFGITPTEMGFTEDVNRATAQVQKEIGRSRLILAISDLIEEYINYEIVWMHFSPFAQFTFIEPTDIDERLTFEKVNNLVHKGILTINEGRKMLGNAPTEKGGDTLFIMTGMGPILVEDLPYYVSEEEPQPENQEPVLEDLTEEEQEQMAKIFKVLDKNSKSRTIEVQKALRVKKSYRLDIEHTWEKTRQWFIPQLLKAYKGDRETAKIIGKASDQLYGKMRQINKKWISRSVDDGVKVAKKIDKKLKPDSANIKKAKEKVLKHTDKYTSISLLKTFEKRMRKALGKFTKVSKVILKADANNYDELFDLEFTETMESAFTVSAKQAVRYAANSWYGVNEGLISAMMSTENEDLQTVWWLTTSGVSCGICKDRDGESYPIDNVPYVPCDGSSECYDNCLCLLIIGKDKPAPSFAGMDFTASGRF